MPAQRRQRGRRQASGRKPTLALRLESLEPRCVLDSTVVFNEIMYHPTGDESLFEWIELYNQHSVDVDLSGWSLQGGTEFTFAEGTVIGGRSRLVVAASPATLQAAAGISGVLGPLVGRLDNAGEKLSLLDNNNRLLDEVEYKDDGGWPVAADGSGAALAKRALATASEAASSWTFSTQVGGTPGAENFPPISQTPVQTVLLPLEANWRYDQSGVDLGTAWRAPNFDDSAWANANAVLSTGDPSQPQGLAISLNFGANAGPGNVNPAAAVGANIAGVVAVGNWNDIPVAQQTGRSLKYDSGVTVHGLTLSTTEAFAYSGSASDATNTSFSQVGDTAMMRGHIYHGGGAAVDLAFTGSIPFSQFDVYVYYNSGAVTNTQTISILDSLGGSLGLARSGAEIAGSDTTFVPSNGSGNNANYVKFAGLTSDDIPANFMIRAQGLGGANQYGYINGVQIVARAETWDLADDFSATDNPSGPWRYGTLSALPNQGGAFTPFSAHAPFTFPTLPIDGWTMGGTDPNLTHNPHASLVTCCGGAVRWDPNQINVSPSGAFAVDATWTAPSAGVYTIDASFFNAQAATAANAYVYKNTSQLFAGSTGNSVYNSSLGANFTLPSISLAAGDVIHFLTDGGNNKAVSATIASLPGAGAAELAPGPATFYFRSNFNYTPGTGSVQLTIEPLVDDGAVYYLNGEEIYRQNMPDGDVSYSTFASSPVGTATLASPIVVPAGALLPGNNVLAVEVHQSGPAPGDSDAAFGVRLTSTSTPAIPTGLQFNEVASGIGATFQVELVNSGDQSVNLAEYVITILDAPVRQYVLPAQTLAPGGYLALSTAQLGFDASVGDRLFLYGPGSTTLLDGVTVQDRLRGRSPAHQQRWLFPSVATFGAANSFAFHDEVVINEIMYHPAPVVDAPALIETTSPIPLGSTWKYDQSGTDLGAAWRQPDFDDASWSSGAATFGEAAAASYSSVVLSHNPTAYWRLGETPTTGTAFDSAPLAGSQNGTYSGVTTRPAVIAGDANAAADFSVGSSSGVSGTGLSAAGVFSGDWSIEAWFVRDSVTQFATLFSNNGAIGNTNGPAMAFIDSTNRLGVTAVGTSSANVSIDLGSSYLGKPVYAVITKTGGNTAGANTITIYAWVDGVPLTPVSGTTTWNIAPHDAYLIGRYRSTGFQIFDGAIDEVALYSRVLTPAEISAHAQAGMSGANVATPLNLGPTTYYFRQEFDFAGDPSNTALTLRTLVDDGAVFYLNGQEIYRHNMPVGEIGAGTNAASEVGLAIISNAIPLVGVLNAGPNVLAVEVHQANPSGQDVKFDAELIATSTVRPAQAYAESSEEWIELYNRSSTPIDLAGWKLDEAIDFTFPSPTLLGAGEYLVVAKDAAALAAKYPTIRIVGNYLNNLTNSGARVVLKDGQNNPADEVQYYDSGNWPERTDGGGSSLELRDPDADNSRAEAWAASDESAKSEWQTYTTRRIAEPYLGSFRSTIGSAVPPTGWNEFVFGLLDSGEVLIDDIRVIENPDTTPQQLIVNGTFEADAVGAAPAAWRFGGNHQASVVADPTDAARKVLRIVASGTTSYLSNNVETTFVGNKAIVIGREYEVSFRAKWVGGSQQLNNRAFFTLIPQTTILNAPQHSGTPGAVNSRRVANIGPTFHNLAQQPAVPAPGQAVTVSVNVQDPDNVTSATLRWAAGGGAWQSVVMTQGTAGAYSGVIPGQVVGTIVQFYVEAQDALGATSMYPAAGPNARAVYEVNDGAANPAAALGIDSYRLIMTAADSALMNSATNLMSDAKLGATLIINESLVIYNAGVTLKGSQHSRNVPERVGFSVEVPPEYALRGVHRTFSLDRSSRSNGTTKPSPDEIIIHQFLNHAGGLASEYDDLIYLVAPRSDHTSVATLRMARLSSEFLDSQYNNGSDGSIYEFEMLFTAPGTTNGQPDGPKLHTAGPFADYDIEYIGSDKELYRFEMQKKNNLAEDDFDRIIELGQALELTGTALDAAAAEVLDADQWMRTFAARSLIMDFDGYGSTTYRHNHGVKLYVRPDDQKVLAFLWDVDGSFVLSPNGALYPQGGTTNLTKLIERPDNLHRFYGHLHDMISTTWNSAYMSQWMAHYSVKSGQNLSVNLPLVQQRANYVLSQLPAQVPFAITTNGGADFSVNTPTVDLAGNGWVNVREIRIQGRAGAIAANWTSPTAWHAEVPLQAGAQLLVFQAYDFQGNLIGTDSITLTSSVSSPQFSSLRISEIHYHPADPGGGSPYVNSDFEFIELQNIGSQPLQLDGAQLAGGIQFTFAPLLVAPGGFVLVVNNLAAFESRYGTGFNIAGEFSGNLSNSGEQIQLLDSASQVILDFTYQTAWAPVSDGDGPSLVVINTAAATPSWNSAASWRASRLGGGSPGALDPVATVSARHVFYNNSKFDGNNAAANAADDAAIASDKTPLVSGTGSFANYTSFNRGLNGIMVDVAGLVGLPTAQDFIFRVGNNNTPGGWANAPAPSSISVRPGAGVGGSSRVTIVWADGAIQRQWLQVTVKQSLGLTQPDVFYFGNAIGDTGSSPASAQVNSTDELAVRNNPRTFLNPAPLNSPHDFNRDGLVNATDQILVRSNSTSLATALQLISVPGGVQAATAMAPSAPLVDDVIAIGLAAPIASAARPLAPSALDIVPKLLPESAATEDPDSAPRPKSQAVSVANHFASLDQVLDTDELLYDLIAAELVESRV